MHIVDNQTQMYEDLKLQSLKLRRLALLLDQVAELPTQNLPARALGNGRNVDHSATKLLVMRQIRLDKLLDIILADLGLVRDYVSARDFVSRTIGRLHADDGGVHDGWVGDKESF